MSRRTRFWGGTLILTLAGTFSLAFWGLIAWVIFG